MKHRGRDAEARRVYLGASPRGSLALQRLAQAKAILDGRDFVLPDDVKTLAYPALGHRIILNAQARVKGVTTAQVIEECVQGIPVPGVRAEGASGAPGSKRILRMRACGADRADGPLLRNYNLVCVLMALRPRPCWPAISGHWLFYRGAYIIGGLIPLCFVWARMSRSRGLDVTVERTADRLQVGQETETRLRLKSHSTLTKLWLEIEDQTDMPGGTATDRGHDCRRRARATGRSTMRCRRRGVYSTGPVKVTTGDPFGLFRITPQVRREGSR